MSSWFQIDFSTESERRVRSEKAHKLISVKLLKRSNFRLYKRNLVHYCPEGFQSEKSEGLGIDRRRRQKPQDSGELRAASQCHCAVSSRLRRGVDDRTRTTGSESWESVLPSCGRLVRMNVTKVREVSRESSHQENELTGRQSPLKRR